jgi:acetolactate synthase-1/2/3 large subunit
MLGLHLRRAIAPAALHHGFARARGMNELVEGRKMFREYLESSLPTEGRCTDVLVSSLEAENVEWMFGIPGEENLDLLDSLAKSHRRQGGAKMKLVVTRHEQAAGFMAATVGRLTGHPAACLSTLGPGATNFSTALAYGFLGGFPMICITGQKPIRHSKQGAFQILDVCGHFNEITKMTKSVDDPDLISPAVRNAILTSREEKPGPVHLEIAEDIAALPVHKEAGFIFPCPTRTPIGRGRRPLVEPKAIDHAVALIHAAKRPLICIAAGANRKSTQNAMKVLMLKTGLMAVCTQMGKGVVSEDNAGYIGCTALSDNDLVHVAIKNADLIINVGHDISEKPPFIMNHNKPPLVIHLNFTRPSVDPVYFPHLVLVGDIAEAVWQFSARIRAQSHWDFTPFQLIKDRSDQLLWNSPYATSDAWPMTVQRLVADTRKVMPADGIVSLDNGMYKIWFARQYKTLQSNTLLLDNALATMGAGLPCAMAAKLVFPEKACVAICGDGGFMMNSQEIETALRLKQHIVCIVLNNKSYGMIAWKAHQMGMDDFGLDYGNPDFAKYAESYGAIGHNVTSADEFVTIFRKCIAEPGVHVIDLPISYETSDQALHVELPQEVEKLQETVGKMIAEYDAGLAAMEADFTNER